MTSIPCPRIVVAGTNSGVGKTSVTLALVAALRKRGLRVQTFKVGPDYLDPTYLTVASGRPCYNLDGWMMGMDYVRHLFATKAADADISVIEGVMGLFDGSDPVGPEGSTAEIAVALDAPVLLVVNVHGVARSISALVKGFTEFEPRLRVAGIVANQCGSERHGYWLGESLKAFGLPTPVATPVRGAFPRLAGRHLGLVTADDRNLPESVLSELGDALERYGSIDEIVAIARSASPVQSSSVNDAESCVERTVRIGLAFDEAFHFYYADNLEAFEAAGCRLIRFSPLRDEALPENLDALYFGGGYPEVYASTLAENSSMLDSVRSFARSGRPVYAECGGLMYLAQGIRDREGRAFPMAGLLPAWTIMLERLKSLGYVEVTLAEDSLFGNRGDRLRGHEFHYSELSGDPTESSDWKAVYKLKHMRSETLTREGFQLGRVLASYVHAHVASHPRAVRHFVSLCRGFTPAGETRP